MIASALRMRKLLPCIRWRAMRCCVAALAGSRFGSASTTRVNCVDLTGRANRVVPTGSGFQRISLS